MDNWNKESVSREEFLRLRQEAMIRLQQMAKGQNLPEMQKKPPAQERSAVQEKRPPAEKTGPSVPHDAQTRPTVQPPSAISLPQAEKTVPKAADAPEPQEPILLTLLAQLAEPQQEEDAKEVSPPHGGSASKNPVGKRAGEPLFHPDGKAPSLRGDSYHPDAVREDRYRPSMPPLRKNLRRLMGEESKKK